MEQFAVFVDTVDHARRLIEPMLRRHSDPAQWIVVACPPRLSRHVGRWVSHANREQWQRRWLQSLRTELEPSFSKHMANRVHWFLAQGPLDRIATRLRAQHGDSLRLLDARRPKFGREGEALIAAELNGTTLQWKAPVAVSSGVALMLALAD